LARGASYHVDTRGVDDRVEGNGELRVAIAEQQLETGCAPVEAREQIPGLLRDPGSGRVCGHPDDVDLAGGSSMRNST
jgi:hypothetical protein